MGKTVETDTETEIERDEVLIQDGSHSLFYNRISEVTYYYFCFVLLVTHTTMVQSERGHNMGINTNR